MEKGKIGRSKAGLLKRIVIGFLIIGIMGFCFAAAANLIMIKKAEGRILTEDEAAALGSVDCIMVLGCGVWENDTPSPMLRDRLTVGVRIFEAGAGDRLLMSGDHGRTDYDEVNVMKAFAVERGIDPDAVFMDHAGFSTYESAYRADYIFGAEKVIIVTQRYHLSRAVYDALSMGIDAYGVASDENLYAGQAYRELREFAARTKDFIYCILKPEPTYLGDPIDLRGPGSQTEG